MTTLQKFHLFPSLPPELRLQVWEEALFSDAGLWAAASTGKITPSGHYKRSDPYVVMAVYLSTSPASLACRESWYLSQHLCVKERALPKWEWTKNRCHGMIRKDSIFHLGNAVNAWQVLASLGHHELSLISHVVIEWGEPDAVRDVLFTLRSLRPDLRTIILQDVDWVSDPDWAPGDGPWPGVRRPRAVVQQPAVSPKLACFYMSLVDPARPLVLTGPIRHGVWRDWIAEIWTRDQMTVPEENRQIPRIHFVTPREVLHGAEAETGSSLSVPDPARLL